MEYVIKTHKGIEFEINKGGIDLESFLASLNTRTLLAVSIVGVVMNKNNIKVVAPKEQPSEEVATHTLITMDGEVYRVVIENYQATEITGIINNPQTNFVLIGGVIIQKNNFDVLQ